MKLFFVDMQYKDKGLLITKLLILSHNMKSFHIIHINLTVFKEYQAQHWSQCQHELLLDSVSVLFFLSPPSLEHGDANGLLLPDLEIVVDPGSPTPSKTLGSHKFGE